MNTYAIGDIQGCYHSLRRLLDKLDYQPGKDRLWLVGDLVNRGPDSLSVMRWALDHQSDITCVLGNHDLHLLGLAHGVRGIGKKDTGLIPILEAHDRDEIVNWLSALPLLVHSEQSDVVLAHAGLWPLWDTHTAINAANACTDALQSNPVDFLTEMYGNKPDSWHDANTVVERHRFVVNALTRMRMCHSDGRLALDWKGPVDGAPADLVSWFTLREAEALRARIVFGHWSALGQVAWPEYNVWCLDTGCVWGGPLTAMRLEDGEIFQARDERDQPLPF